MPKNNMTIKIGGEAGQGLESSGAGFAQALARGGLRIFCLADYRSRIRGGHNFFQIRISEQQLWTHNEPVHLLLALTKEAVEIHRDEIVPGGGVIYDEKLKVDTAALEERGVKPFPVPLVRIAEETGGDKVMANTAALGAMAGIVGYDLAPMISVIEDNFAKKGEAVVEGNRRVAQAARDFARERYAAGFAWKLETIPGAPRRMVINGNQAFALGALLGGCKFVAGYPMTPGSPVLEWMSVNSARYGVVTKHAEDEIAAACMCIGAAHAGVRAMTPTSGGGFSLMVESLGLAGITETPIVIYEAQRPGPATGLPTRTDQGDLLFTIHASQGEFPRIVLTPATIEQNFEAGWRALNLAEKYQCPVIVLTDHFLVTSLRDLDPEALDFSAVTIDRGELLGDADLDALEGEYIRFSPNEDGVSPRVIPGHPRGVFAVASDEQDKYGHIEEDAANRKWRVESRMRKQEAAAEEMRPPLRYGPDEAEITLVGWGSTYGPLREAVDLINAAGGSANLLQIVDAWPFPVGPVSEALAKAKTTIMVENNYTGQMAKLIRMATGHKVSGRILKYDGRAFSPEYILEHIEEAKRHG
jgi:2-oxoglutarate ferredoxin oxidoreductase subunit alpha